MTYDWIVVGAGVHGTYLARELLESGIEADDLVVLDRRGTFLGSFKEKARSCGMDALRSTYVQHVGPEPFDLESFAQKRDREVELHPTPNFPKRPSLELFLDHADRVVERAGLEAVLEKRTVTGVGRDGDGIVVRTDDGTLRSRNVALAVGPGDQYRRPDWATAAPAIEHVWDSDAPPGVRVQGEDRVWVVGGGVTAGQFATSAAAVAETVTLCVRDPIEEATTEANPRWINWRYIEQELHPLPPGSQARYERVRAARNDGTMPEYLARELRGTENVEIRRGEITAACASDSGVCLSLRSGGVECVDRVVLATGFQPVYDRPLVGAVADSLGLKRGHRGVPVLDDETLAWQRHDGTSSRLFVTGALAECSVGPLAGNIHGARRAAERIAATAEAPVDAASPLGS
ncbi:MAG: FAD/NAD(P)-binding protein [Natronomonas sp.]